MISPLVIGVAGGSGSGKSTVVREIVAGVSPEAVSQVHHDAYYRDFDHLTEAERARINFDHHKVHAVRKRELGGIKDANSFQTRLNIFG